MVKKNTEVVAISREEYDALQARAAGVTAAVPGFDPKEPDSYTNRQGVLVSDLAKGVRTLANGSQIIFKVSPNGWLSILPDFIPPQRGKSPRPGYGGYMNRHKGYAAYYRSKEYLADLAWASANGAKDAPSA